MNLGRNYCEEKETKLRVNKNQATVYIGFGSNGKLLRNENSANFFASFTSKLATSSIKTFAPLNLILNHQKQLHWNTGTLDSYQFHV